MASLRDATSGSSLLSVRNSINNSASAIYSTTQIISSGTSMTGSRVADGTTMYAGAMMGNGAPVNYYSALDWYIPNYLISQNRQTMITQSNVSSEVNTNQTTLVAGLYRDATVITSLQFNPNGQTFKTGSSFYLYGIKKS
jgi:hypothetical protein